jgi:two-component system response regulator HydG
MASSNHIILIVDDERSQRQLLGGFLRSYGYEILESASAEEMLTSLSNRIPDIILLDVRLPGMSGIDALPGIRRLSSTVPILLITAYADLRQAVGALKAGASDYLSKPIDLDELKVAIEDALMVPGDARNAAGIDVPDLPEGFVLESPAMRHVVETVAVVAPSDAPMLVLGPSGVGKELIARLIHDWSPRAGKPFVTTNCSALPENLVESELFGHVRGAFTGASENRQGLFRTASGGTLFLDEIGELPPALQPKLLRALESQQVTPVGADVPIDVDVRLVTATNRDLANEVQAGRFRDDLYYRINVIELSIPPLAERREDILPLARHFANEYAGRPVRLSPQAAQQLMTFSWTGNVRELRNAIQRACLLCRGDVIMPEHLAPAITGTSSTTPSWSDTNRLSQVERATIIATLDECDGNRTHAAEKLGISRRTLINKLKEIEHESNAE